jgi:hypothetical protein
MLLCPFEQTYHRLVYYSRFIWMETDFFRQRALFPALASMLMLVDELSSSIFNDISTCSTMTTRCWVPDIVLECLKRGLVYMFGANEINNVSTLITKGGGGGIISHYLFLSFALGFFILLYI